MSNRETQPIRQKDVEPIVIGYLDGDIRTFLSLSGNPVYTPELCTSVNSMMTILASYEHTQPEDGLTLTGSLARYIAGNGDQQTNWTIRQTTAETDIPDGLSPEAIRTFNEITAPDQDIDTCLRFTGEGSLSDLYTYIRTRTPEATESVISQRGPRNEEIPLYQRSFTQENGIRVTISYGPIKTNPAVKHIKIGFYGTDERLFHIDVSAFPTNARDAREQKRQGGLTVFGQDIRIPLHLDAENRVSYVLDEAHAYNIQGKEHIDLDDRDLSSLTELAVRALRIHLIHSPALFEDTSAQSLTSLFFTDDIFAIRNRIRQDITHGKRISKDTLFLLRKELVISMVLDPYETAKFLQDTGIYLCIPGLRTMSQKDWRNLFISDAFTYAKPGKVHMEKKFRSIKDIGQSHGQFLSDRWYKGTNGITMFMDALGEVKKTPGMPLFFRETTDLQDRSLMQKRKKTIDLHVHRLLDIYPTTDTRMTNALLSIMMHNPSGLTEIEMQHQISQALHTRIDQTAFRNIFHEVKSLGCIDKHVRSTSDNKQVFFYSPRIDANGNIKEGNLLFTGKVMEKMRALIDTPSLSPQTRQLLETCVRQLPFRTIESFRPLREWDIDMISDDMQQMMQDNHMPMTDREGIVLFLKGLQHACISYLQARGK